MALAWRGIPHFGAGLFREALMAAGPCGNIHPDTSSSNAWMKYYPGLTLRPVFEQALPVAGPSRLFPRGWQQAVHAAQKETLEGLGAPAADQAMIFGGNFERLFPPQGGPLMGRRGLEDRFHA